MMNLQADHSNPNRVPTMRSMFLVLCLCGCAAQADIAQHLPLLVRQCVAPALKELVLMSMEDIGHFEPMSCHAVRFPP